MLSLLLKALAALVGAAVSGWIVSGRGGVLRRLESMSPLAIILIAFALRVALLALVHLGLGLKFPTDLPGYAQHGDWTLQGQVPNRDYSTPYNFLFSYLLAGSQLVWPGEFGVMVMFAAVEHAGVYAFALGMMRLFGPSAGVQALLLYLFNPLILVSFALSGQDEAVAIGVLGLAFWLFTQKRAVWLGLAVSAGFLLTKITSILALGALLLRSGPWAWAASLLSLLLLAGAFSLTGSTLLAFEFERPGAAPADELLGMMTSGNIWYVLARDPDFTGLRLATSLAALALLGLVATYRFFRKEGSPVAEAAGWSAAAVITFNIIHSMSFSYYLAAAVMPLLILFWGSRFQLFALVLWSWWVALDTQIYYSLSVLRGRDDSFSLPYSAVTVIANIAMLAIILRSIWRQKLDSPNMSQEAPAAG